MAPPVSTPCQPFGMNGCQFIGLMYLDANTMKRKMATSLMATMMLFAPADSRIPKTSKTVSSMTISNPTRLK